MMALMVIKVGDSLGSTKRKRSETRKRVRFRSEDLEDCVKAGDFEDLKDIGVD